MVSLRACLSLIALVIVVTTSAPASAERLGRRGVEPSVEVAFQQESATPGSTATLRFFSDARGVTLQIFHAGSERARTRRSDVMNGVAASPPHWLGNEQIGSLATIDIGAWETGLYFARVRS